VELDNHAEVWQIGGSQYPIMAMPAVAGRPKEEWTRAATRYSDIRRGCYEPEARVRDMDLDGVYACLNFPSTIGSFAGTRFLTAVDDPELAHALVRAWNDWYAEEWVGQHPDRSIGCGIACLGDPQQAAVEVRRNAARGFTTLSFPENPADLGLPALGSGHWDPLFAACEEVGTVVCLHVGSSHWFAAHPTSPFQAECVLFPLAAARAAVEFLWSGIPARFPDIQIVLAEGGVGWIPMVADRMAYVLDHSGFGEGGWLWPDHPRDLLARNFNFCTLEFDSAWMWPAIGIDRIMVECDFPHADSLWPDTQARLAEALRELSDDDVQKVTWENASRLYRHPVPDEARASFSSAGATPKVRAG
jgi:predicted TIM-barrel fold metal-dependent hydrolase